MKKIFFIGFLISFFLLSCNRDYTSEPKTTNSELVDKNFSKFSVNLRGLSLDENETRYLGKGFNLLSSRIDDEMGFRRTIIDINRLETGRGWDPWSNQISNNISLDPVDIEIDRRNVPVKIQEVQDISDSYFSDSLGVDIGYNNNFTIKFNYNKVSQETSKTYSFKSYSYKLNSEVFYSPYSSDDYSYLLKRGFIRDLKEMNASELVNRYGTHLVTHYYLGAYSNLVVSTLSNKFSKEETLKLTSSYLGASMDASLRKKYNNNKTSVRAEYSQGGSDYNPPANLISYDGTEDKTKLNTIDLNAWIRGINPNNKTFMSLPFNRDGLIPIPDIIKSIPLKVKYICGIQYHATPNKMFTYVFCDPKTYKAIKYKGNFVFTRLDTYDPKPYIQTFYLDDYGIVSGFTESLVSNNGNNYTSWIPELDNRGLWTLKSVTTGKYLCTDLKTRIIDDDNEGKRFWFLNPIINCDNRYSSYAFGQVLIK